MDSTHATNQAAIASRPAAVGWIEWCCFAVFTIAVAPGVLQVVIRTFRLFGFPFSIFPGGDVITGVLSGLGAIVALVLLLILSFRRAVPAAAKYVSWTFWFVAVGRQYWFADNWSSAF